MQVSIVVNSNDIPLFENEVILDKGCSQKDV